MIRPSLFQHVGIHTSNVDKLYNVLLKSENQHDYASWFKEDSLFVEDEGELHWQDLRLCKKKDGNICW